MFTGPFCNISRQGFIANWKEIKEDMTNQDSEFPPGNLIIGQTPKMMHYDEVCY